MLYNIDLQSLSVQANPTESSDAGIHPTSAAPGTAPDRDVGTRLPRRIEGYNTKAQSVITVLAEGKSPRKSRHYQHSMANPIDGIRHANYYGMEMILVECSYDSMLVRQFSSITPEIRRERQIAHIELYVALTRFDPIY